VYLSSETGQVMKVISDWSGQGPSEKRFLSVQAYEREMRGMSQEFTGLPTTAPKITFEEVLRQTGGALALAKQTVAYYVLEKSPRSKEDSRPVWVIHLCGPLDPAQLTPPGPIPGMMREDMWVSSRTIVHAETGKRLGADNTLLPEVK
jgi:hypothetical protein